MTKALGFMALGSFVVGVVALIVWGVERKERIVDSCYDQGRAPIGGGHAPILCYDTKTGQVFVPKSRLK
jgi:hypothetical protein